MLKKLFVALAILVIAVTPFYSAHAQLNDDVVVINPVIQNDIEVQAGQKIIFNSGWMACTPGLVKAFQESATIHVADNGEPFNTEGWDWSPITSQPFPEEYKDKCIAGNKGNNGWVSRWQSPELTLEPGVHVIYFYYDLAHWIIDGSDLDGDGQMDYWERGVNFERTFTITVLASE